MEKAIARRPVAMIPVMVARDSVTAEQGILVSSPSSPSSSSSFSSLFSADFPAKPESFPARLQRVTFTSHGTTAGYDTGENR